MADERRAPISVIPGSSLENRRALEANLETRKPDQWLGKILSRFPDPFWEMNDSMRDIRIKAREALARNPIDLDECEALVLRVSRERHG